MRRFGTICFKTIILVLAFSALRATQAFADEALVIGYLEQVTPAPPTLSNLDQVPENLGLAGAALGIDDNKTTGKFLGQTWALEQEVVQPDAEFLNAAKSLLTKTPFLVVKAPRDSLLALADLPEAQDALLFNISAADTSLRDDQCRRNVLHIIPSRAMLADALAQFGVLKRWTKWVLIGSTSDADKAFAERIKQAAKKYRIDLRASREWTFEADMRRNAAKEVPLFTQDFPDYDMMIIADEAHDYGRYVMYNTWLPRPVAGSEGIVASAWRQSMEQHGAAQLQSRFFDHAKRDMQSEDYAGWAAIRAIGEAVTRAKSGKAADIRGYLMSEDFKLAAFKGRALSFRTWNGQLRQPIPLSHPSAVVALAPLEGFLHRRNEMDTLGLDEPESRCTAFND